MYMEKAIEKLFNEMLNQILTEKQECKHANDDEFDIDELMNGVDSTEDKLRIANDIIIMLQSIIMALKDKYEESLNENHELKKYVKLLKRFLRHSL